MLVFDEFGNNLTTWKLTHVHQKANHDDIQFRTELYVKTRCLGDQVKVTGFWVVFELLGKLRVIKAIFDLFLT